MVDYAARNSFVLLREHVKLLEGLMSLFADYRSVYKVFDRQALSYELHKLFWKVNRVIDDLSPGDRV